MTSDPSSELRAPLLARRIPVEAIEPGRAYIIHARNGGAGIALYVDGHLGYRLHREKFGRHFLFIEWDWAQGPPFGTAIPLRLIDEPPPGYQPAEDPVEDGESQRPLLDWLAAREREYEGEIQDAWRVVLGTLPQDLREKPER